MKNPEKVALIEKKIELLQTLAAIDKAKKLLKNVNEPNSAHKIKR